MRVLVVGYGNGLRGDDGVGWHVVQALQDEGYGEEVAVQACHQLLPEVAERLCGVAGVIFVDACVGSDGDRPGAVRCERVTVGAGAGAGFSHHLSPAVVLAWAQRLYGCCPEAVVCSVVGESFGYNEVLSPAVTAAVPVVLAHIRATIADWMGNVRAG
jgi:hydrogenase maturation protease